MRMALRFASFIPPMPVLLVLGGALPLAAALFAQYGLKLPPCHFCILQRWPYGLVILGGLAAACLRPGALGRRLGIACAIMGLLATGLLGLLHSGIESGFIRYTGGCVASDTVSVEAILASPIVACDAVMAAFAGLSMAGWNSLYAFALLLLVGWRVRHGG